MTPTPDDRCSSRSRRPARESDHAPIAGGDDVGLTPLGRQFMELLRQDERYRDILANPWDNDAASG
jgi:hypothetical protein